MQSNRSRVALALAAIAVAVVAFLILRPDDDDEPASTPSASQESTQEEKPEGSRDGGEPAGAGGSQTGRAVETIEVENGSPIGGVAEIEVSKGDPVLLEVRADVEDEVHVHGYDEFADVTPGDPAKVEFTADLEGIYEIELEGSHTQIAELEVRP
jgi:hypothetical protein